MPPFSDRPVRPIDPSPAAGLVPTGLPFRVAAALALMGVWLLVGLLSAGQYQVAAWWAGQESRWGAQIFREVPVWQVWTLLTPAAVLVARRFPLSRDRLLRHLPLHIIAAALCAVAYLGAWIVWSKVATPSLVSGRSASDLFWAFFRARFNLAFLLYWAVIGLYYAVWNYRRLREREVDAARAQVDSAWAREEAARARAELERSRLDALRSQLQPHFLFNTLHSIASLMDEDVATARRLIARLSELLRTVLEHGESLEVTLAEELRFLEQYLEIERVRYGPRLRIRFDIDEETPAALVPPLLLQPLVENAVRHGIAPLEDGGSVTIRSRRADGRLLLQVTDTGRGYGDGSLDGTGLGLRNTGARLRHLYGSDHSFELEAGWPEGVSVTIEIPYRRSDATAARGE